MGSAVVTCLVAFLSVSNSPLWGFTVPEHDEGAAQTGGAFVAFKQCW